MFALLAKRTVGAQIVLRDPMGFAFGKLRRVQQVAP